MAKRRGCNLEIDWDMVRNNVTFQDYYCRLKNYALNMFEWVNLPPTCDERFLELTLFDKGFAIFFENADNGAPMATMSTIGGELNVYQIPTYRRAYAVNGFQQDCNMLDSVLIFNNYLHTPTVLTIEQYAYRLYIVQRAIDTNLNGQKTPILIRASEENRLSLENIYSQYNGNAQAIIVSKDFDPESINVLDTHVDYIADKLEAQKHMIWNEALSFLGIRNANTDKKERLIVSEAESVDGQVEASRFVMLNSRRQACREINAMFGLNLDVRFRTVQQGDLANYDAPPETEEEVEDE